jgi:hypothetical protein
MSNDFIQTEITQGNLYLNFSSRAEQLAGELFNLRRKYGTALFPNWQSSEDILYYYTDRFWTNEKRQSFFVANLTLANNSKFINLLLRPAILLPSMESELPNGLSLAIRLSYNTANGTTNVDHVIDISNSEKRDFENEATGLLITRNIPLYHQRRNEIITTDFIKSLPLISVKTKHHLQEWNDYLDWKDQIITTQLIGLRYIAVDIDNGKYRFLVAAESQESFYKQSRILQRQDCIYAYHLTKSTDEWDFKIDTKNRGKGIELGDPERQQEMQTASTVSEEQRKKVPWENPYLRFINIAFNEDTQNDYDNHIAEQENVTPTEEFLKRLLNVLPQEGFLALSAVGDFALVGRLRRQLQQLQEQSGYAPFLSSYLFDIKSANVPDSLIEVNQWMNNELNDDQKQAVRTMISAPDIALIQGPPGTGKTTMIAEATYQFIQQEKTVLLSSQANLAVDNALERLISEPSIRAVRLGQKGEEESPYHQNNMVGTYYKSIATLCKQRTLEPWKQFDEEVKQCNDWFENTELVALDIEKLQQDEHIQRQKILDLQKELVRQTEQVASAERAKTVKESTLRFGKLLENSSELAENIGELREDILQQFFVGIVLPINILREIGINLNPHWTAFEYGNGTFRTNCAVAIWLSWTFLLKDLCQLQGDRERLKTFQDQDSVLAPEMQVEIIKLQLEKVEIEDNLTEENLGRFNEIKKRIKELKHSQSVGLDISFYQRTFNFNESWKQYTNSTAKPDELLTLLDNVLTAIENTRQVVENIVKKIQIAIEQLVTNEQVENFEKLQHQTEVKIQIAENHLKSIQGQRVDKEKMLSEVIRQSDLTKNLQGNYFALKQVVENRLQKIRIQYGVQEKIRESWEGILQKWVTDLESEETIHRDRAGYFQNAYIKSCNVVGVSCTENPRTLSDVGFANFDVAIVDEVSKVTPPEILMPLSLARTAILVGDHRQLPPLFKEKGKGEEQSLEEVVAENEEQEENTRNHLLTPENYQRFEKMVTASLFKEHFENAPQQLKAMLFTQYRMHPNIMDVINRFYEGRLQCGLSEPDKNRQHGLFLKNRWGGDFITDKHHTVWIDSAQTPDGQPCYEIVEGTGKKNTLEAALIAKTMGEMETAYRQQGYGKTVPKKRIAVISFYGKQIKEIRNAIRKLNIPFNAIQVDVNTVDRFQGQERPIIFVSMVRRPKYKLSKLANTAQYERINVAFSRAQELLVIVGAAETFLTYPVSLPLMDKPGKQDVDVYRHLIQEFKRNGCYHEADTILSSDDYRLLGSQQPKQSQVQYQKQPFHKKQFKKY